MYARTDLAMEEQELWRRSAGEQTELSGVWARTNERRGIRTTVVKILDENGARQLRKPVGTYLTLELGALARRERSAFARSAYALAAELRRLTAGCESVLVAGLGNDAVTPDAVGPLTLRSLIVTRHLKSARLAGLEGFRDVSAVQPGVLGTTGVESVELVRGAAERVRPQMVLVVDALAAREPERVCTTVQLADSGIVPAWGTPAPPSRKRRWACRYSPSACRRSWTRRDLRTKTEKPAIFTTAFPAWSSRRATSTPECVKLQG